jgi:hypothetical protein
MPSNFVRAARSKLTATGVGAAALACLAWAWAATRATGQPPSPAAAPALLDNMDGAAPALRLLNPRAGVQLAAQSLDRDHHRFGGAAEHVVATAPPGDSAQVGYGVPAAPILDELRFTAWISCSRPGAQLAAMVVLPRSEDSRAGGRRQLLVRSGVPAAAGSWQQLSLGNLPALLAANVRVARAQNNGPVDERGAYVSHLVVLAPGGEGVTELWVDQIAMYGAVFSATTAADAVKAQEVAVPAMPTGVAAAAPSATAPPGARPEDTAKAALRPPAMPRLIQWQGESFSLLQRLGFDAVALGRLPTRDELGEARRLALFLVCPPPSVEELEAEGVGDKYDCVLAWDLGDMLTAEDVEKAEEAAQVLRRRESIVNRSLVVRPRARPLVASRIADLLLLDRVTLGSSLSLTDYASWLTHQRRLARPGTRVWIGVDTHWSANFMAQLAALRGGRPAAVAASFDELSLATTASFGTLPRGFYFKSESSLASPDPETRRRALALELTNLRLGLVEPWLAAGRAATAARSSRADLTAMVLTAERSHLLVPVQWGRGRDREGSGGGVGAFHARNASRGGTQGGANNSEAVSFLLPGVPESSDAYLLSVAGPRRLETRRVAGGLRLVLDHLPDDGFILLTEDGYAFSHVERYLRKHAARAAQARVELAALNRQRAARAVAALPPVVVRQAGLTEDLARVDAQLAAVHQTLAGRDFATAFSRAAEADQMLDELAVRACHAVWPEFQPSASPLPADWSSLAELGRIAHVARVEVAQPRPLPAGDFESLDELLNAGWRRQENPSETIQCAVRLSPLAPQAGAYSLELEAKSKVASTAPPSVPGAPVWITSPPLAVPPGHLVEITGWARVDEIPIGSADPLVIFDSIGGEESEVRVATAPSWTPFRMVRAAPAGAECRLTIALGGVGKAQVDSLRYRLIPLETPAPQTAAR